MCIHVQYGMYIYSFFLEAGFFALQKTDESLLFLEKNFTYFNNVFFIVHYKIYIIKGKIYMCVYDCRFLMFDYIKIL